MSERKCYNEKKSGNPHGRHSQIPTHIVLNVRFSRLF